MFYLEAKFTKKATKGYPGDKILQISNKKKRPIKTKMYKKKTHKNKNVLQLILSNFDLESLIKGCPGEKFVRLKKIHKCISVDSDYFKKRPIKTKMYFS